MDAPLIMLEQILRENKLVWPQRATEIEGQALAPHHSMYVLT